MFFEKEIKKTALTHTVVGTNSTKAKEQSDYKDTEQRNLFVILCNAFI